MPTPTESLPIQAGNWSSLNAYLGAISPAGSVGASDNLTLVADSDANGTGEIKLKIGANEIGKVDKDGALNLGLDTTIEGLIRWRGRALYANDNGACWETGIDVANAPTYSDLVLAARAEGGTSVTDWVYIKNGRDTSNSPAIGIGSLGGSSLGASIAQPSMLRIARNTNAPYVTSDAAWHNLVLAVRDSTSPAQSGMALVVQMENGTLPFAVSPIGRMTARQFTTEGVADANYITNDEAALYVRPKKTDGKGIVVKSLASQTDNLLEVVSSGSTLLSGFDKFGYFFTTRGSVPASADVATSSLFISADFTAGAMKVTFTGKDSGGTLRSAQVAMT